MMYQGPSKSPWGKVQTCDLLCPGVFLVSTASHGGTMVSNEVAAFLSPAAKRCGFKRSGYLCFEEDTQEDVVLRELLDKKLWQIPERIKDKAAFEENINLSIRRYNPEYWRARQSGLEAAQAARKEAQSKGLTLDREFRLCKDGEPVTEVRKLTKEEIDLSVRRVSRIVKIGMFMDRYPAELSGGQQQRVAIARTLAPEPTVLFMDEPLSNLDAKLRLEMRYELQRLHVETGSTFVYVTHDQMEAMTLATQICLINNGVLQQYEAPLDVYHHPANLFVADFVGNPSINFVEVKGRQAADGTISMTMLGGVQATFRPKKPVELAAWFADRDRSEEEKAAALREKAKEKGYVEKGNKDEVFRYHIAKVDEEDDSLQDAPEITNEDLVLGIRPEFLDIADSSNLRGEIYGAMPTGMESTIKVRVGGFLLTGVIFGSSLFTIGSEVPLSVTGDQIMLFDRKSGRCITSGSLTF